MRKKVAMIGVGKLGEPCAEAMSQYHNVVGYDVLPRTPAFPMKSTIAEAVEGRDFIFIVSLFWFPMLHKSFFNWLFNFTR